MWGGKGTQEREGAATKGDHNAEPTGHPPATVCRWPLARVTHPPGRRWMRPRGEQPTTPAAGSTRPAAAAGRQRARGWAAWGRRNGTAAGGRARGRRGIAVPTATRSRRGEEGRVGQSATHARGGWVRGRELVRVIGTRLHQPCPPIGCAAPRCCLLTRTPRSRPGLARAVIVLPTQACEPEATGQTLMVCILCAASPFRSFAAVRLPHFRCALSPLPLLRRPASGWKLIPLCASTVPPPPLFRRLPIALCSRPCPPSPPRCPRL